MRNIIRFGIGIYTSISCASAYPTSLCESLIQNIAYNTSYSVDQQRQANLNKANFCLAEYNSASASQKLAIEASYNLFSGAAGSDSESIKIAQKSMCDDKFGQYWYNTYHLRDQKIVSDRAMASVDACIIAESKSLRTRVSTSPNEDVTAIILNWGGNNDINLVSIDAQNAVCSIDGQVVKEGSSLSKNKLSRNEDYPVICKRVSSKCDVEGVQLDCLKSAFVTIKTQPVTVTVPMFERYNVSILTKKAEQIELSVLDTKRDLVNRTSNLSAEISNLNKAVAQLEKRTVKDVMLSGVRPTGYRRGPDAYFCNENNNDDEILVDFMFGKQVGPAGGDGQAKCARLEVVR